MEPLSPIRVVALTSGGDVPSARFRVRQHIPLLRSRGIDVREFIPGIDKYLSVGAARRLPGSLGPALVPVLRAVSLTARRPGLRASRSADVTWLERELIPGIYSAENRIGRPFVFDVDDAIWAHRDARHGDLQRIAREASVVIAGNDYIAEWFRPHAKRVEVIPTAIDTSRFVSRVGREPATRLRVGWTGTSSNFAYLESIEGALARFVAEEDAELVIISDRRPRLSRIPSEKVRFERWTEQQEAEAVRSFDVGLMPLFDDEWGRGKCGFKALQYMSCAVPAVISPVGFNKTLTEGGGAISAADEEGWLSALRLLAKDSERREDVGRRGRRMVERDFSCEVVAARLAEVLRSVAGRFGDGPVEDRR